MNLIIKTIKLKQIYLIKSLWEQLNKLHLEDSTFFKDHYRNFTFEERCKTFSAKESTNIQINIISDNEKLIVEKSLSWFEINHCDKIQVSVAEGHESVYGFYEKFDFYPRLTSLMLKKKK